MSFEEEWSSARTTAAATGRGGARVATRPDLKVDGDELGAVGSEAYGLHQRLSRDGDHARPATFDAAVALTGADFSSGAALLTVHDRWNTQLHTLLDACAQISNHLDYSAATHAREEADIAASFSTSKINECLT
ncbi:hypothetical protein [Streptomyces sp. NRRL S-87]|uniref:hypothetical protein n=1 Tax=Streptomyces sp. NRRL S-87 TaxID=1463920 RepID=UPI0004BF673F|nr:hypothetical protein [Streptomyces sp. NRRL S-87]